MVLTSASLGNYFQDGVHNGRQLYSMDHKSGLGGHRNLISVANLGFSCSRKSMVLTLASLGQNYQDGVQYGRQQYSMNYNSGFVVMET